MKRFNFKSAVVAGFIATIVMTIFMAFFDMNITKMLGMAMGKTGTMAYVFGGIVHLIIGIIYGIIFGLIIQPIFHKLPVFLSGILYGVIIAIVAMVFTPQFMGMLHKWGGGGTKMGYSQRGYQGCYPAMPEHPCYPQHEQDQNGDRQPYDKDNDDQRYGERPEGVPDQPEYPGQGGYGSSPYYRQNAYKPCPPAHEHQMHPCGPAKKATLPDWLWVLINHVVYGFALGIFYRPRKIEGQPKE